ncbi:putative oligopeptide transporter, OPT superfamily [Helianthus annuus]|nr:putative oligopeptide transporter, OPT superfamily [Helianthus annuus]
MATKNDTGDTQNTAECTVEEVALVVPETDDTSLPVMTFRAWTLGVGSCIVLIFLNTFFIYRTQPLAISAILMQIAVLPIGKFMAATLPTKEYKLLGRSFSLNPGPFNMKEHVIITVFANCGVSQGGGDAYSIGAITVMKAYYRQSLSFLCGLIIVLTTQILGYGWAGMLRRYLVDPVEMWWPSNLAQVSLFRALHEKESKAQGMTRMRFFMIFLVLSFAYYALPGYIFPILTFFSWVCWVWPHNITAQQIGSGYNGLGVGAFTLDWAGISAYHGRSGFARFTATLTHVALFHGGDIWKQSKSAVQNVKLDIHAKLMKNYKQVPQWWYLVLLIGSIVLSLIMCFVYKEDVQLPWWGFLFAFALAFIVTLPIGVIQATTNQQPGYDIIAQFIFGYILPGKPIANLLFKIYGRISTVHALSFLSDLKLGHYMKIPPKCMFTAQLVGTLVAGTVNLAVSWWMLENIENLCDIEGLHPDSPWTCPKFKVTFDASVIWGLIGPERLFGPHGLYRNLVWLFLIGAFLPVPVWIMSKIFPEKKWIPLINIPVISYGFAGMPPATPTNIASWLVTGMIFNYFVFKYRKQWWQKYNYVLSAALDAGTAFMGVLLFFALQNEGVDLKWWGAKLDHCPLATCPTAPGINVTGCPVF